MKFRVERDVLAEAVAWTARSLPARPPVPVLAGLLLEADATRPAPGAVQLRLRGLRPGRGRRRRRRARRRSWSPAGCSPTSPAACPASPVEVATDGAKVVADLRHAPGSRCSTLPVEDYPTLPDDAAARRRRCAATLFAAAVAQVVDRRRPRRHAAGAHRRPGRDRGREGHPGRHRPLPARRPRADLDARSRPACRRSRWCPARTLADTAKALAVGRQGHRRAGVRRQPARAWSASRAPAGARRRGCSTASSRSTARCCPAESRRRRDGRDRRARRGGQAGRAGRRAQHPGPAELLRRRGRSSRPAAGDEAQAVGVARRAASRATTSRSPSTRRTCSTGSARSTPRYAELSFTASDPAGGAHRQGRRRRDRRRRLPLPAHAGAAVRLRPTQRARCDGPARPTEGGTTMEIGLIGLGKMGGNMARAAAPRRPHRRRLRPQPGDQRRRRRSSDLVAAAAAPAGGLGDGAGRRRRPGRPSTRSASCSTRATSSSTAATRATPTTRSTPRCSASAASASSTPASPAASGAWTNGYALMVGGDAENVAKVQPVFDALKPEGESGFVHAGAVGAGHFAKMVHNGIEYGLMQAYAEGYELLEAADVVDRRARRHQVLAPGHRHPVLAARPAGAARSRRTRTWPSSAATPRTPARAGGPSRRRSTTRCRCR